MSAVEYNEGDLVEAVKGATVIRGLVTKGAGSFYWLGEAGRTVGRFLEDGFTITVIEKAAPVVVLPTEPGLYATDIKDLARSMPLYRLNEFGEWSTIWAHMGEQMRAPAEILDGIKPGTLTRLEPVSETAKKVLDRVRTTAGIGLNLHEDLKVIASQFGVEL